MRIKSITAIPISYRVPEGQNVRLGIGVDAAFVRAHPLIDGPCYV